MGNVKKKIFAFFFLSIILKVIIKKKFGCHEELGGGDVVCGEYESRTSAAVVAAGGLWQLTPEINTQALGCRPGDPTFIFTSSKPCNLDVTSFRYWILAVLGEWRVGGGRVGWAWAGVWGSGR